MSFLLDTDTCVEWLKGNPKVTGRVESVGWSSIAISPITAGELFHGAYASRNRKASIQQVKQFLRRCKQRPFLINAMEVYGKTKARLQKQGIGIESRDLLIASTSIADG